MACRYPLSLLCSLKRFMSDAATPPETPLYIEERATMSLAEASLIIPRSAPRTDDADLDWGLNIEINPSLRVHSITDCMLKIGK